MSPTEIEGMPPNVTGLALGERHACAVTFAGGVVCWGSNADGELGLGAAVGDKVARPSPVRLPGKAVQVVATNRGTCALLDGGDVYCWGEALFAVNLRLQPVTLVAAASAYRAGLTRYYQSVILVA